MRHDKMAAAELTMLFWHKRGPEIWPYSFSLSLCSVYSDALLRMKKLLFRMWCPKSVGARFGRTVPILLNPWWRRGVPVTSLGVSTRLLYVGPG